jgi:plastocyanin
MNVHPRLLGIGAAALLSVGLLAACGGDDDDSGSNAPAPERPSAVPADAPFIDQQGLKFTPNTLTTTTGTVVYFANTESAIHSVTINGTNESGTMKHDDIFQWTAPAAGTYKITCDFHPQMKATITIT